MANSADAAALLLSRLPAGLDRLRTGFRARGWDIRVVGGAVRDALLGLEPKDLDLCTDADPDGQRGVYEALGLDHHPTGLAHGTWTVCLPSGVVTEVTSLRVDRETDGRRAKVEWTSDWEEDLRRRDLTVNAMSADLDGGLHDPFGGAEDLAAGRIRFVGDAGERIREDYLRILRWVRFEARLGRGSPDPNSFRSCRELAPGLSRISRERIWSEVSRIAAHPSGAAGLELLDSLVVGKPCGTPGLDFAAAARRRAAGFADPAALLALCHPDPAALAAEWRWSRADRERALFVAARQDEDWDMETCRRRAATQGVPISHLASHLASRGRFGEAEEIAAWPVPPFPRVAQALVQAGERPGPAMGEALELARQIWADGGYTAGAGELADRILEERPSGAPRP